ncbi:hypothetical protein ACOBQX_00135 [Actinokineospora sp. G85]|uniref:hypothetical protein n=1 Tax=Actinokineospora sp. G85 TaxID=3406626 RepID=UPI003C7908E9
MPTTLSRRALSATTIALAAAGIMATTAPTAQASTYTYCSTGSGFNWVPYFSNPASQCPGFTPNGAPYVFEIGTYTVLITTTNPWYTAYQGHATATCNGYHYNGQMLFPDQCTVQHS